MSLDSDQITAKNFKTFYEQIRPYLNGSFPTPIANKFSKGDMYSTDERIIGQWIDGKPLYQRTYNITSVTRPETKVAHGISNIDSIVDFNIKFVSNTDTTFEGNANWVNNTDGSTSYSVSEGRVDKTYIVARIKSGELGTVEKIFCTIQYTKTTDTPIEIGSDTDYSTTEKIIGTWIDGKPVYQKTVVGSTVISPNERQLVSSNVDRVINAFGQQTYSSTGEAFHYPYLGYDDNKALVVRWLLEADHDLVAFRGGSDTTTLTDYSWTFQYTKTTD